MNPDIMKPLRILSLLLLPAAARAAEILVEAESFASHGGWTLDTQFIEIMGSPYLLAHGLGRPVADASANVRIPEAGRWRVFVRTKDWVSPWQAPGAPGKFSVLVNGKALPETFGTGGGWHWQPGGSVELPAGGAALAFHDLTGFDGRCDAIYLTNDAGAVPPETRADRRRLLGLPEQTPESEEYDLVVCGGGYSGMGAAIAAARQGLKVALLQNRPVLGGNGSSEIQVWAQGGTMRGLYPHLGEIIEEFADHASNSPGEVDEYGDARKEAAIRTESGIGLFLNHHVIAAEQGGTPLSGRRMIRSVTALDTRSGREVRFRGKLFADCTGHGSVGALAGASFTMLEKGHLGMSNMWSWQPSATPSPWPETPWALPLEPGDFPPTRKAEKTALLFHKGEWFWESGFDRHPLNDLELTRDWNLRAVYGAFGTLRRTANPDARLSWVAAIGGTRESRLLQGDVVLTDRDIVEKRPFPDGCVPTTWDLDLHYPKEQYAKKFPDNPFISRAQFGKGVDRENGYPIPYRCLYSKDVDNLFMAGRCISVTHEALGTVRVMRTCGMMGEVVGKAAWVAVTRGTTPRGVYQSHLDELKELWRQPGGARRASLREPLAVPPGWKPPVVAKPGVAGLDPKSLPGVVVDDSQAACSGPWTEASGLPGFVGKGYRYAAAGAGTSARFDATVPTAGAWEVRLKWSPHPNRATNARVTFGEWEVKVDQRKAAARSDGFQSIGRVQLAAGGKVSVLLSAEGADGFVHADAIWLIPVP
jgi:hypothetical protein